MDSNTLYDNHGRPINYLRLAVTDRCNLRCFYCMPAEGVTFLPRKELLTYEEIVRIVSFLAELGVNKVRITGGEPFLRRDLIQLIEKITAIPDVSVHLTTNGVLTAPFIPRLKELGVASVNLSLDTTDRARFAAITHRDEFERVWATFEQLLAHNIPVKINCVVMDGRNIDDILPLVELTRNYPVAVRFIEEMPFNGEGSHYPKLNWTYRRILSHIRSRFPAIQPQESEQNATANYYAIPGFRGSIGIIAAFSRTFCGTCNRIRITAQGMLKTCLYDDGVFSLRDFLRGGASDQQLEEQFLQTLNKRAKDGFEAEKMRKHHAPVSESMSTIGG